MIQIQPVRPEVVAPIVTIAKDQPGFNAVEVAHVSHPGYAHVEGGNTLLLAFRPDELQRERIAAGEDIYVSLLTFGGPMQGIIACVGKNDASLIYNVPVALLPVEVATQTTEGDVR